MRWLFLVSVVRRQQVSGRLLLSGFVGMTVSSSRMAAVTSLAGLEAVGGVPLGVVVPWRWVL